MILVDVTNWRTITACLVCLVTGIYIGTQIEKGNKIRIV